MPLPLNHFGNGLDPRLPTEIKPLLYYYDEYQTYDLLRFNSIRGKLGVFIKQYFGYSYNSIFNSWSAIPEYSYALIERFTPKKFDWCKNYSSKLYNFFSQFAGTGLCNDPYFSGENHPYANNFDFGYQVIDNKYSVNWATITLSIPKTDNPINIGFSYLRYAYVGNSYPEYIKYYQSITTTEEIQEITLFLGYVQPCSLVIICNDSAVKNNVESQIEDCYLYSKIDLILSDLLSEINSAFPLIQYFLSKLRFTGNIEYIYTYNTHNVDVDFTQLTDDDFSLIPDTFRKSALVYANNNQWEEEQEQLSDILPESYYFYKSFDYPVIAFNPSLQGSYRTNNNYTDYNSLNYFYYINWNLWDISTRLPEEAYNILSMNSDNLARNYSVNYYLSLRLVSDKLRYDYLWLMSIWYNPNSTSDKINYLHFYFLRSLTIPHILGFLKAPLILAQYDMTNNQYSYLESQGIVNSNGTLLEVNNVTRYDLSGNYQSYPINAEISYDLANRNLPYQQEITVEELIYLIDTKIHYKEILATGETTMPDSIRIKEIHDYQSQIRDALYADKFAYENPDDPDNSNRRVANLGYYIERIARILGISVNPDGSVRSIRQSKHIKQGDEIPAGWSIGQWGRNQGDDNEGQKGGSETEDRDGLAYEVRTNKFTTNLFTGQPDKIEQGGYVLVENLPQLLHIILDDFDKALGMAEAGANVLPSPNNSKPIPYEGINTLLAEIAYMISQLSRNITGTHISSLKNQGMLYELIAAQGVPTDLKSIEVDIGVNQKAKIAYPSIKGTTQFDQTVWIITHLALLLGSQLKLEHTEGEGN